MKLRTPWLASLLLAACLSSSALGQTVVGPAGVYTVQTPGTTKVEYGDGWIKISWAADPAPNPEPGPAPGPAPPPVPPPAPVAVGKLFVTLVYDSKTETQDQATARADLALSQDWPGLNAVFSAYEVNQKVVDERNLRGSVGALPSLIVQELKDGAKSAPVIKSIPSVSGSDAVLKAVKDLRGTAK